jgi:peptidoglycan/LPS O-acetylase OafA/YrhL
VDVDKLRRMTGVQVWGIAMAIIALVALTAGVFAAEWDTAILAAIGIAVALLVVVRGRGDEE